MVVSFYMSIWNYIQSGGFKRDIFILLCFWFIAGFLSLIFFNIPYYDWFNYHNYNSWAYFNNRYDIDFLAANYRSYFIPYADLASYVLWDKLNFHPYIFTFIEAFDTALVLTLTYKIGDFIFNVSTVNKNLFNIYNSFFIIFSPVFILSNNFSMNDMRVAIFVLFSFYILIKNLFDAEKPTRLRNIFLSGLVLGIGLALKLTTIIYVITVPLIMLVMFKKISNPLKSISLFCLGIGLSFVLISGHWYYNMYKHFDNPFFPYFNNIFHSGYSDFYNFVNMDFEHVKARNIIELIFFPFFVSDNHTFGNSEYSYDLRYAGIFVILLIVIPLTAYIDKIKKQLNFCEIISINNLWFIILYIAISYYINIAIFGTYRYIIPTSVLFGFIVIIFAHAIFHKTKFKNKCIISFLLVLITIIFCFTKYGSTKLHIDENLFNVSSLHSIDDVGIEDGAYVFLFSTLQSFVIPFQNPNAKYVLIPIPPDIDYGDKKIFRKKDLPVLTKFLYSSYLAQKISNILNSNSKVYFMAFNNTDDYELYLKTLKFYSNDKRKINFCNTIVSHIFEKRLRNIKVCDYN